MSLSAGLVLAAMWFMPMHSAWMASPARLLLMLCAPWYQQREASSSIDTFQILSGTVSPHVLGLLLALGAATGLAGSVRWARLVSIAMLTMLVLVGGGIIYTEDMGALSVPSMDSMASYSGLIAAAAALAYLLFAGRLGRFAYLYHGFAGIIAALLWFAFLAVTAMPQEADIGVYVSLAAVLALLVSTTRELAATTGRTWWNAEMSLLTCMLHDGLTARSGQTEPERIRRRRLQFDAIRGLHGGHPGERGQHPPGEVAVAEQKRIVPAGLRTDTGVLGRAPDRLAPEAEGETEVGRRPEMNIDTTGGNPISDRDVAIIVQGLGIFHPSGEMARQVRAWAQRAADEQREAIRVDSMSAAGQDPRAAGG